LFVVNLKINKNVKVSRSTSCSVFFG